MITVASDKDSQPAVFLLQASQTLGRQTLTVDFYHKGRLVGSAAFATEITQNITGAPLTVLHAAQLEELPMQPPPPADLELRIVLDTPTNTLYFTLHSETAALGYQRRTMGSIQLNAHPRQFLQ